MTTKQDTEKSYYAWHAMLQRCQNPNHPTYRHYGGRGIRVCPRWSKFENFLEDMGCPIPGTSLDRIDNNGDYSPENCRWASRLDQQNNKRDNHVIEFQGKRQTISQWARELGMGQQTLFARINKYGWSIERSLTETVGRREPR